MKFLRDAYGYFTEPGGLVTLEQFETVFERVTLVDNDFNTDTFKPGIPERVPLLHASAKTQASEHRADEAG